MKKLRFGFTTGSAAAFASKAAACDVIMGFIPKDLSIMTPKQIPYSPEYTRVSRGMIEVIKDAGDDPDVTDGMTIRAVVKASCDDSGRVSVVIDGGRGVGRVTKPGLDQPVGNAAINSVPRQMIRDNVLDVCRAADFHGRVSVIIEAEGGDEIAQKTFNPRLGIRDGISILGTTGIVEPMSEAALVDTIRVEIHQKKVLGEKKLLMAFGNYGQEFLKKDYGLDLDSAVKCSNFIKDALMIAEDEGFGEVLLVGHLGKIVKVAGGFSNTHSKYGDCRMEILVTALIRSGVSCTVSDCRRLAGMNTTEEACDYLADAGFLKPVMTVVCDEILATISRWVPQIKVHLMVYTINQRLIGER